MSLWQFLTDMVQHNQFAQAALVAAPVTAVTYALKSVPKQVYRGIKKLVSVDVRFNSDMPDFEAVVRFITKQVVYDKFSRNFTYQTETKWDREEWTEETKHHGLTAGYGTHIGFYKGHLVIVDRFLDEGNNTEKFKEHLVLTFFTRAKQIVRDFTIDVAKAAGNNVESFDAVPIHINSGSGWGRMGKLPLRRMETVFTADDAGNKLVAAIRAFEAKKDEHHRLGLPHHLGIMMESEPGCGKSSMIHAVASATERSIYYLNLGSLEKDKHLTDLLNGRNDWSKIILAIEDIDAAGVKVNRAMHADDDETPKKAKKSDDDDSSPVTLSALLNVLDGILCPDGLVVIATTNHHERLDPALTRPGRFDHTLRLGKIGYDQFVKMASLFNTPMSKFDVANDVEMTGAEMRALIMKEAA